MFDEIEPYVVCDHSFQCSMFSVERGHADAMLGEVGSF
jgi:hypothetical protein